MYVTIVNAKTKHRTRVDRPTSKQGRRDFATWMKQQLGLKA